MSWSLVSDKKNVEALTTNTADFATIIKTRTLFTKYLNMILHSRSMIANETVLLPGAKASLAGSARHAYYSMVYDCREEHDVVVSGVMNFEKRGKHQWRYCSVTCYEFTSLPLAGYFDDETMVESSVGKEKGKRKFKVILTCNPTRRHNVNEIDVSNCKFGVCVVRLVYPEEDVLEEVKPTIVSIEKNNGAKNKIKKT